MKYFYYLIHKGTDENKKNRPLHSFLLEPKHRKRNNTISQMRLRSVFKMRMSILSTATTEQMGYGIVSFSSISLE